MDPQHVPCRFEARLRQAVVLDAAAADTITLAHSRRMAVKAGLFQLALTIVRFLGGGHSWTTGGGER